MAARQPDDPAATREADLFRQFVLQPGFPCLGARSAINRGQWEVVNPGLLGTELAARALVPPLTRFVETWRKDGQPLRTFVATFSNRQPTTELDFEQALFRQLGLLSELDAQPWDERVAQDADHPGFSYSFAGEGFFVVGLHPNSSRLSRRFSHPTLVFNPHQLFEGLRERGKLPSMQRAIRARDMALQGSTNPNLSNYGEAPESRQYSGRQVEREWACPFQAPPSPEY